MTTNRLKEMYKLVINLDKAIERTIANKDPETVDLLLDIRRGVGLLVDDVKEMKETLNGLMSAVLSPDIQDKKDSVH